MCDKNPWELHSLKSLLLHNRKGGLCGMFVSLIPLITIVILLLSDICVLSIGKYRLGAALDAGMDMAENQYQLSGGVSSEYKVKKACMENYPDIKKISINSVSALHGKNHEPYIEISASVDIPTCILASEGNRFLSISLTRRRDVACVEQ